MGTVETERESPKPPDAGSYRWLVSLVLVAALYFLAAKVGLRLAYEDTNVSPVWPPSGVAVVALVFLGIRAWPAITVGAFLANYLSFRGLTSLPFVTSAAIGIGNTLEAVFAFYVLKTIRRFEPAMASVQDVTLLAAASALGGVLAATSGVLSLVLTHQASWLQFQFLWFTWWLGDTMGIIVVGSALCIWLSRPATGWRNFVLKYRSRVWEAIALIGCTLLIAGFVLGGQGIYPFPIFPVLVWSALRFGQRGGSATVLTISAMAVWATINGSGPFVTPDPVQSLLFLQTFMAVAAFTTLLMGAAISERARTEQALREAERRFRLALGNSDVTVYTQDPSLRYTWIYDGKKRFDPAVVIGRTDDQLAPAAEAAILNEIKMRVLKTGVGEREEVIATTENRRSVYDLFVEPLRDETGRVMGVGGVAHDITAIKQYQADVEALNERLRRAMRETHHRVKNNLQIITAMIDMRLMEGQDHIPADEVRRLATITTTLATIHDLLTRESKNDGLSSTLSSRTILDELAPMLQSTAPHRTLRIEADDVRLTSRQSTSLSIVVSELVGNAIKHGSGPISVAFRKTALGGVLEVCDEGQGFSDAFDLNASAGTGLELVENLSRLDLGGEMRCFNLEEGGACVAVTVGAPRAVPSPAEAVAAAR
jgi:integral membrane sensor domain MASE1/two-component sensor histidine kinase